MSVPTLMPWPTIDALRAVAPTPPDVTLRRWRQAELPTLPALLLAWYPTVRVGAESVFLDPRFLEQHLVTEERSEGDIYALCFEREGAPVAFMSFERQPAAMTLHARLGALSPEARAGFVGALGFAVFEALGQLCQAELLLAWVTLAARHQQVFAERRGFAPVGLVPGFDRDAVSATESRRVPEVLYAKLLVEDVLPVDEAQLTPRVRELWTCLQRARASA